VRIRKQRTVSAVAAALFALAGCTSGQGAGAGPVSASDAAQPPVQPLLETSLTPTPSPDLPFGINAQDVSGYSSVCGGSAYSGAAAYTGPGPHPIALFGLGSLGWNSGLLPTDTDNALDPWYAQDVAQVQLVACVTEADGPVLRSCGTYQGQQDVTVTLVWGDYTISLYQARTHASVGRPIDLRGDQSTSCPTILMHVPADASTYAQPTELSGPQVKQALAQYVN
jgi:hypothetical protein